MSVFEWIAMAKALDADGLEMYEGFFTSLDNAYIDSVGEAIRKAGFAMPMLCCSPDFTQPEPDARRRHDELHDVTLVPEPDVAGYGRLARQLLAQRSQSWYGAFDNGKQDFAIELSRGDVVEKEQRPSALNENVIHAVVDEITADRIVAIHHHRHFQLCADAIRARNQNRARHVLKLAFEHAAKCADVGNDYDSGEEAVAGVGSSFPGTVKIPRGITQP